MTKLYDWSDYAAPCSEETCSGRCIAGVCEPLPEKVIEPDPALALRDAKAYLRAVIPRIRALPVSEQAHVLNELARTLELVVHLL